MPHVFPVFPLVFPIIMFRHLAEIQQLWHRNLFSPFYARRKTVIDVKIFPRNFPGLYLWLSSWESATITMPCMHYATMPLCHLKDDLEISTRADRQNPSDVWIRLAFYVSRGGVAVLSTNKQMFYRTHYMVGFLGVHFAGFYYKSEKGTRQWQNL